MSVTRILLSACASLTASALAAGAVALPIDPVCDERARLVAALEESYGEQHHAVGLAEESDRLVELWVSGDTGSWSILLTQADGISCLAAAGSNWMEASGAVTGTRAAP